MKNKLGLEEKKSTERNYFITGKIPSLQRKAYSHPRRIHRLSSAKAIWQLQRKAGSDLNGVGLPKGRQRQAEAPEQVDAFSDEPIIVAEHKRQKKRTYISVDYHALKLSTTYRRIKNVVCMTALN